MGNSLQFILWPKIHIPWHSVPLKAVVLFFFFFFFCFSTSKKLQPIRMLHDNSWDLSSCSPRLALHYCRHDTTYCIIRTLLHMAVFKLGICSCLACVYRVMDIGGSLESTNVPKEFLEAQPRATLASWVLFKLPKCIHNSIYAQVKAWANSFIT